MLGGIEIGRLLPIGIVRRGVGYVPEDRDVFAGLTVQENLRLWATSNGPVRYDLVYDLFPELPERSGRAGTMSGGQQQMARGSPGAAGTTTPCSGRRADEGLAPNLVTQVAGPSSG